MKILIIDGEVALSQVMISYLSAENYRCEYAGTYNRAQAKISIYEYDCILLDLDLPDGDGSKLLEEIKKKDRQEGVIIISARQSFEDKIAALQQGADDYLTKPFYLPELSARIFSVIRRRKYNNSNIIRQDALTVDLLAKTVQVNDLPVPLTRTEFDLLLYFIGNRNRVLSKQELAEQLSGDIAGLRDDHNVIYAHVKNLKRKLHDSGAGRYLKTIYATGYKWEYSSPD
ncbi:response regulator transcription factor [Chitinophaga rhizophila]|uniref:Response regulator transcription factor n=1 Tax=Chitinophaga rhizophila TaxID=2866212 RepID=A0ABS7GLJ5_9BACT|nr:response regulator transcription factor [Chitinophaga rhizophila]MBW8687542.1 response regulator transcription factor [Chitinophaga rhizophila]